MKSQLTGALILCVFFIFSCKNEVEQAEPIDYNTLTDQEKRMPENALLGLETNPELETTLFASEPMLVNPTNMDIDARGRVWVTEGFNYRNRIHKSHPVKEEGDRIVILEDEDGDGKADTSKVFYQGTDINSALGILVLGNKVIVSCSPLVIMLTDTDGDDKADKKEILFSGIQGIQHDHGAHAFVFGPDGKLYFNFGNSGERLLDKDGNPLNDKTGAVIDNSGNPFREGMVFRCNMDLSELEVLGNNFRNNYEVAVDSYGTLWQSDNDDDGNQGVRINYVMEYGNFGYKDQMTGEGWRSKRTGMSDSIPLRHWHLNDPGVVPNLLQTGAGSPTGIVLYEGNLLPEVFQGQIIHTDAGPNVVRSYPVKNDGAGYKATIVNVLKGNKDQWFRPSDVCVAPDGSLMVSDWYDPGVGGHGVGDLKQGRIFRIAPKGKRYDIVNPSIKTEKEAIEAFQSPNMATRYLGFTLLESMGSKAESGLKEMWSSTNPIFKARALWLLTKMEDKRQGYLNEAIADKNSDIRITAIRIARNYPETLNPILKQLSKDANPQVRREVAIALRNDNSVAAEDLWVDLALQYDGKDRWYLEALGIGAQNKSAKLYQKWLAKVGSKWNEKAGRDIVWRLRDDQTLDKLVELISTSPESWDDKLRYFRAFDFHSEAARNNALLSLVKKDSKNKDQVVITALSHFSNDFATKNPEIKKMLNASLKSYKGKTEYLELVRKFDLKSKAREVFALALDSAQSQIGIEAFKLLMDMDKKDFIVTNINKSNADEVVDLLGSMDDWEATNLLADMIIDDSKDKVLRERALNSMGKSRRGQRRLISIIENGELPASMDSLAIKVFLASGHEDLRKQASDLLQSPELANGKTFSPINQLVKMDGDVANGEKVFQRTCVACHQVNGKGIDFGPKLSQIGSKLAKSALYKAILDPSEAISFGYEGVDLKMKDGTEARGYIASNTENYIELVLMGGLKNRYQKSDIETTVPMEGSLMTSMAVAMEEQELVDLVTYLEQLK